MHTQAPVQNGYGGRVTLEWAFYSRVAWCPSRVACPGGHVALVQSVQGNTILGATGSTPTPDLTYKSGQHFYHIHKSGGYLDKSVSYLYIRGRYAFVSIFGPLGTPYASLHVKCVGGIIVFCVHPCLTGYCEVAELAWCTESQFLRCKSHIRLLVWIRVWTTQRWQSWNPWLNVNPYMFLCTVYSLFHCSLPLVSYRCTRSTDLAPPPLPLMTDDAFSFKTNQQHQACVHVCV